MNTEQTSKQQQQQQQQQQQKIYVWLRIGLYLMFSTVLLH